MVERTCEIWGKRQARAGQHICPIRLSPSRGRMCSHKQEKVSLEGGTHVSECEAEEEGCEDVLVDDRLRV